MALIDDFKTRFPQLDTAAIDVLWASLEASWPCYYGFEYGSNACTDEAILNLIAHLFVVEQESQTSSGSQKDISSQSVGSVSVTYSGGSVDSSSIQFFNTTIYGQKFLMLIKNRMGALPV